VLDNVQAFESEYLEACRKLNTFPFAIRKFGSVLPPLPWKQSARPNKIAADSTLAISKPIGDAGKRSEEMLRDPTTAAPKESNEENIISVPNKPAPAQRKLLNGRREIAIQEFLKRGQMEGSLPNLFGHQSAPNIDTNYQSKYKFIRTMNVETSEPDDEEETISRIQIRGWRVNLDDAEALSSVIQTLPNLSHVWY
jgi:hypothetical protein